MNAVAPGRLGYIDNIRWTMIILVLSMHSADTYSPFGNWYYTEHPQIGLPATMFFGFYQTFLQAFFMGLLFFIAGYFTPRSYDSKGAWRYLHDRLVRLGAPTLLYMVLIGPMTEYFISHSWHTTDSFPAAWWQYVRDGQILSGSGPLWFCVALLIFCSIYMIVRLSTRIDQGSGSWTWQPDNPRVTLLIIVLWLATFAVRVVAPSGTAFFNMQIADFPQYVILFTLGILAYRGDWLVRLDNGFCLRWCLFALAAGTVLWVVLISFGGALQGDTRAYGEGWHWQNAGMSLWASLICVGMGLGMQALYRKTFNAQGKLATLMSANAFGVYVFHPPILIAIALLLHSITLPAVPKFALLTALSVIASFTISELMLRRIPYLKKIL